MRTSSIGSVGGHAVLEPLQEEPDDLLGDGGERVDPLGAVLGVRLVGEQLHLLAHRRQHGRTLGVDERLVEPAEPHAAGQVADDGEPQLGGEHEPVQHLTRGRGQGRVGGDRFVHPVLQERHDQLDVGSRALLCEEHPEHGVVELAGPVEALDAVVAQHPQQPLVELLGQCAPLDVHRLEEGVEPLPGRVHAVLDVLVLAGRAVAAELGEVGEQREQRHLVRDGDLAVGGEGCGR